MVTMRSEVPIARPTSDFSESELWPLASKLLPKVKIVQGKPKVCISKIRDHQKGSQCGEGQNQETTETKGIL